MTAIPGDSDKQWILLITPWLSDDDLEWFLERVAIRCADNMPTREAYNLTHSELLAKQSHAQH